MNADQLTHIDGQGRARMVDITAKDETHRSAVASGEVILRAETLDLVVRGQLKKGDLLGTARIAGIAAAKRTADLIPLCHPIAITGIQVDLEPDAGLPGIRITARVDSFGRTGVEMEALTAVSVAALTVYDMAKAVEKGILIRSIRLEEKHGGKSGDYVHDSRAR